MTKETIKRHLISLGLTFVATFFLYVGLMIKDDAFIFTTTALQGIFVGGVIAATRAIAKVIYEICYDLLSVKK